MTWKGSGTGTYHVVLTLSKPDRGFRFIWLRQLCGHGGYDWVEGLNVTVKARVAASSSGCVVLGSQFPKI